ncbi:collagen binding domain-containing protein, partial [uncultured Sharpea sp.]|uniref:MSCRAMM family protein n=1 Tax=uncultured Sharpea sp. TaxID=1112738 RepID=UPI0025908D42
MKKIKNCMRSTLAVFTVMAVIFSLILPSPVVKAEGTGDQQLEKIESFKATLEKGAVLNNGKYIWNTKTDADDHRFVFRVDYSMSGVKELEPGAIKIWIPKTILKDRSGKYADYMDLSIPSEDEYNSASEEDKKDVNYVWKELKESDPSYKDHENCIEITNVKQRTAGENGYFEVAYVTNEQTFEYKDEATYKDGKYVINETPQSDPFYADISVTNTSEGKPQTVTASTDKIPVYINTTAEISSTDKRYPNKMYREWQSSWGKQPDEAKGKYFLVWEIVSKIKKDPTQPFTFTLEDTPVSKELHLLGYSMGSQSGPFTTAIEKGNQVTGQRSDSDRYDYVLTYYDPTEFKGKDYYELKNSVKATVTPEDSIDDPTSANSSKVWEWDTPKFVHPTGHFYGEKYGDNNWHAKFGYYHDYSSYSLDKMQKKDINSIDTFRYYIDTYGYPLPWTRDGDADDPSSYGKKKVTYQLSDDELYLEDKITTKDVGTDQLEFGIPEGAHRLDSSDYQFLYADWNVSSQFRKYDDEEKKFVTDPSGKYSSEDVIHFWVKTDEKDSHDGEYKEVASYNLGSGKASISDSSIVKELTRDRITFKSDKDDPSVTGIRFTTSNAYYYTKIEAYPMVRLKNSDYVMKKLFKDENPNNVTENNCKSLIRLHNFAHSNAYQAEVDAKVNDNNLIYGVKVYAFDRAIRPKKESEIHKHIVSTGSNKVKKKYVIRWKITPRETLTTDSGTDYLVQDSGTFYDLLPKGTHLQKGSIDVETEKGMLSHSSFSYSVEEDYKGSGRDLIKVSVPVQAKYYNLYLNAEMSWDAIHDYGTKINNPVAYETGNEEIYNGYPDDDYVDSSGTVHKLPLSDVNKAYMTKLDPKCKTNRFIYDEEPHDIDTLTAAVSGLKKQIKDSHDASYSYETYTTTNGSYSYKIRFANTMTDKAKNLIFFDSLENYNLNGKHSDWHGFLKRFDVSQLKQKGIEPVIYVSKTADLSIDAHHDLTDNSVWQKVTESTNLSEMHAFAIDCRKTSDGKDFVLNQGESISAVVYMQAPASVSEVKGEYAKAYNNIYIQDTIMSGETSSDFFIHQDYTEIRYRVSADISIHKQSTDDESKSIEGAKYTLKGKSDYGTEVNEEVTTGKQGDAVFEGIEKGTYTLKESYSPIDWLLDRTEYTVKVDGAGKITCDGKEIEKTEKITLKDSPRIHGDISFMKYSTAGNNRAVTGAKFRLSGKSKYGTDVMEYATSDATGKVKFENIEWGSYKLKEVEAPDGYIPDRTEYTAVISDSGIGGIEDAEMLKTGSAVIRNEPYHTVEISKQSSYDNAPLSGAEFRLTGTSDYGTPYDKTATSGENGLAKFDGLEAGTYIIQETKSPKDYFLDSTKHIVKVNKDDTYTIDGLEKNDSHYYRMNNKPEENGKIIVKKKWKDTDETKRPTDPPVIHITTDINKVPTYAVWRNNYAHSAGPFYYVDSDYKVKTKKVEYAKDITSANQVPAGAVRLDKNYDDPNAKYKIWGWLTDDGTMHYWT